MIPNTHLSGAMVPMSLQHTSKLINSIRQLTLLLFTTFDCLWEQNRGTNGLLSCLTYRHAKKKRVHLLYIINQNDRIPDVRQQRVHMIQNYGCDVNKAEGCCCPDDQCCWQEAEALLEPPHDLWTPPTGLSSLLTSFFLISIFLYLCYLNQWL